MRLTGKSAAIGRVRRLIKQVSGFDTNVLITGQSGTGKELVARSVHELSARCNQPFVPINCGAIPPELLESELFGHEKGAFTGAVSMRKGRFELAEGGTLFLDEIGDMSLQMQAKLLRVLQERSYERVGSNKTRQCDVRIISATHRNLPEAMSKGAFREDLYYRLNVFPIDMPSLSQRVGDMPILIDELAARHECDSQLQFSEAAMRALTNYHWPGNVRELSNLVERLAILHPVGEVDVGDLPKKYRAAALLDANVNQVSQSKVEFDDLGLKENLQRIERDLISKAMRKSNSVVAKAARLLNLQRTTLVEKLRKYDL